MRTARDVVHLELRVARPVRASPGGFSCAYELVEGKTTIRAFAANGEDSLQAMLLALAISVVEVEMFLESCGGTIPDEQWRDLARLRVSTRA